MSEHTEEIVRDASIELVRAALRMAGLLHAHEARCELFIEALDAFDELVGQEVAA